VFCFGRNGERGRIERIEKIKLVEEDLSGEGVMV
jgi:hypothetical protein